MNKDVPVRKEEIIEKYIDELMKWNEKIRLTGYRSREEIEEKLMKINIKAASLMEINGEGAGIGSGNGSLEVAIKATYPLAKIFCIERNKRKAAVIRVIMHNLGLMEIEVVVGDINDMKAAYKWEWVVMREVRVDMKLIRNIRGYLKEKGKIYIITSEGRADEVRKILRVEEKEDLGGGYFLVKALCFM